MSLPTIHAGARYFKVTTATAQIPGHPYIEIGVAGTQTLTSTMIVQFTPSEDFAGDFAVLARTLGKAADTNDVPFIPVPYQVGNLNNVAQVVDGRGWPWATAAIGQTAIIAVPASGLSLALLNGLTAGSMQITTWDVNGSFGV